MWESLTGSKGLSLICRRDKAGKQARGIQRTNTGGKSGINFAMSSPTGYFLNDFDIFLTEMLRMFSRRLIKRLVSCTFGHLEWMLSDQRSLPMRCFRKHHGSGSWYKQWCSDKEAAILPSPGGHTGVHCSHLCWHRWWFLELEVSLVRRRKAVSSHSALE